MSRRRSVTPAASSERRSSAPPCWRVCAAAPSAAVTLAIRPSAVWWRLIRISPSSGGASWIRAWENPLRVPSSTVIRTVSIA